MSSARLNRLVNDAYLNNNLEGARGAFTDYLVSSCYHPQRVRIYDSHQQISREIFVPCGRCYHCIETKINSWCTRMYAHAEDFKNVYFVTLTYRSFVSVTSEVSKLILSKLQDAIWHRDSYNSTHHLSYNPCLLVKSHYQNFIKRLRKNTGLSDLTYVLSGEYGSKFGRPHFHMILFTNGELTERDIIRAWSVCLWKSDSGRYSYRRNQSKNGIAIDAPIGHIDFHNLVSNGTFNTTIKIKVDGSFMNAARCFGYVCKYVCKRDNVNYKRVSIAYNSSFNKLKKYIVYTSDFQFSEAQKMLENLGYNFRLLEATFNSLKQFEYEEILFQPDQNVFNDNLSQCKNLSLYGHPYVVEFFPKKYFDYRKAFSPFCEFSRGTPIGSIYATRHLSEFKEGIFNKPILQDAGFVVPSYFRFKASQSLYGLRKMRKGIKGVSYNLSPMLDLLGRFEDHTFNFRTLLEYFCIVSHRKSIKQALSDDSKCFRDCSTGEKILLCGNFAQHYKFDRHIRDYVLTRNIPISDWIRSWCVQIREELERFKLRVNSSKAVAHDRDAAICKMTDLGLDPVKLTESFIEQSSSYRKHKDLLYTEIHNSVE